MANRTDLTPAGFVDDLFVERAALEIRRTGDAHCSFVATSIDRGHYFLGLHRGSDEVLLWLHAPEYIKARPAVKQAT